jgi:hypothetical protein
MFKRNHIPLILVIFIGLFALACVWSPWVVETEFPKFPKKSSISELSAESFPSGNVHVKISYMRSLEENAALKCDYPDGYGKTLTFSEELPKEEDEPEGKTSFDFFLTVPGNYQVVCTLGDSRQTAGFKIESIAITPSEVPITGIPTSRAFYINGAGTWTINFSDPPGTCTLLTTQVTLQVNEDETADLQVYYPSLTTYGPPCTISTEGVGMDLGLGALDRVNQTVTYTSCANGIYKAEGQISYKDRKLSGEVTCYYPEGNLTSSVTLKMP